MIAKFFKGDKIILKSLSNKIGIIDGEPREQAKKILYPVSIDPSQPSCYYPENSLEKFIPPKTVEELLKSRTFSNTDDFIQTLIYKKLEKPLSDNLYTFYASRTEFQVHQFKPVLKFLNTSKQRLLLADEVGLGKTIEAGIIITEIAARLGELSRVLIVCPSMLISKWEKEMQRRFNLEFKIIKRNDLLRFLERYHEYGQAEKLKGIVSLQTIRSKKIIENLRNISPHFDIVVVDEAHYMRNKETLSNELGEVLSELADSMIFLSATPLQMGTSDLFNLLNILIPEEFSDFSLFSNLIKPNEYINDALRKLYDPPSALSILKKVEETSQKERFIKNPYYNEALNLLTNTKLSRDQAIQLQKLLVELNSLSYVFTRTKKRDIDVQFPVREARLIRVDFTSSEMSFYNAVTDFVAERFTTKYGHSHGISFAVIMPQRQVASCIQAMKESIDNIIRKGIINAPSSDDGDVIDQFVESEESWKLGKKEISSINKLKDCALTIGDTDTKFDKFLDALQKLENEDPNSKIIVFAFFKKTLEYLERKLSRTIWGDRVAIIHGGVPNIERLRIIKKFQETNKIKILLSSEVGSEGLDFQFCNVIFNYDLPWNPMRVEQRIGRLDRYGQSHEKILIYNFSMVGTIDDVILTRLYNRIKIFEQYIGDLDAILGNEIKELTREVFNTNLTREQKIQLIEKRAENIVRKQKELEEFEKQSQRFIGQDEYFNQEVTRILETKRFITSDEVKFFFKTFLQKNFLKTTLLPPKSGKPDVFVMKSEEEFSRFIRRYSASSENINELEKKFSYDGGFLVTFNDKVACKDDQLEFITVHHPIIKAIKRFYDNNKQNLHATAVFCLRNNKYEGEYFFFIFLLEKTALKKDLLLVPVLVNTKNKRVYIQDEFCDWILSEVVKAEQIDIKSQLLYTGELFESAFKEAGEYLGMIREEEEKKLKKNNDILINNEIESVIQANEIKIKKAEETIKKLILQEKTEEDRIVRLHRGRIRNLESLKEQKIKELEQKRYISVGYTLIAGGIVKIINANK